MTRSAAFALEAVHLSMTSQAEYHYDDPTVKIDGTGYVPDWMTPSKLEIYSEEIDSDTAELIRRF